MVTFDIFSTKVFNKENREENAENKVMHAHKNVFTVKQFTGPEILIIFFFFLVLEWHRCQNGTLQDLYVQLTQTNK